MRYLISLLLLAFASLYTMANTPHLGYVYPAGGQQGTSFEIIIGGQQLNDITGIYISGEGVKGQYLEALPKIRRDKRDVNREQENEQIAERVRFSITIDKNAPLGLRDIRIQTKNGFSNRLFFEVNELPELILKEAVRNTECKKLSAIPTLVNGQILAGETDSVRFKAIKGQTIVCTAQARRLIPYLADAVPGWFQAVLSLKDEKGREVAFNDDFLLHPDPVIIHKVPKTQNYTLEIRDAIYRGRTDFVYRLSIGELPYITSIYPLGASKNSNGKLEINGVNLVSPTVKTKSINSSEERVFFSTKGKGKLYTNKKPFVWSNYMENTSGQTHLSKGKAYLIKPKSITNSRISKDGDEHWYKFEAQRKTSYAVNIMARRLGSPLDAQLSIYNNKGILVSQNDDYADKREGLVTHHADPQMVFKTWQAGTYFIRIKNIDNTGSIHHSYRLQIDEPQADFALRIEPSNLTINKGNTTTFTVHALRQNGFKGNIDLQFNNLPEGFSHSRMTIKKGMDQLLVSITAPKEIETGLLNLELEGIVDNNGTLIKRKAEPAEELMQAFLYLHLLPAKDFLTSIAPPLPFSISMDTNQAFELASTDSITFKVKIDRDNDFNLPIRVMLDRPDKVIKLKQLVFDKDTDEAELKLETNGAKPGSSFSFALKGTAKKMSSKKGKKKKKNTVLINAYSPVFEVIIDD